MFKINVIYFLLTLISRQKFEIIYIMSQYQCHCFFYKKDSLRFDC